MSRSLEDELHEAIRDNDFALVISCLQKGADVNFPSSESFLSDCYVAAGYGDWVKKTLGSEPSCMYPLHWAILNCFQNGSRNRPSRILKALLEHGAEPSSRVANLTICTATREVYGWSPLMSGCVDTRGLFRTLLGGITGSDSFGYVHEAKTIVQKWYTVPDCYQIRSSYHDTVIATMDTLLLSERYSDVCFVFPDGGTPLHAHCAILGAKSPYFSTVFNGPWKQTNVNGQWKTSNSWSVMDAILRFIYVGKIVPTVLREETNELFAVASEYQMDDLQEICVQQFAHDISTETIKDTLLLAYLHDCSHLKEACLKFVKTNALQLGNSNVLADLSSNESTAEIWKDLVGAEGLVAEDEKT